MLKLKSSSIIYFSLLIFFIIMSQMVFAQEINDQICINCIGVEKYFFSGTEETGNVEKKEININIFIDEKNKVLRLEDNEILAEKCETWTKTLIKYRQSQV